MNPPVDHNDTIRTAVYLRCYPYDTWEMSFHHAALRRHAAHSGLPEPDCYLDNGRPSHGPLPQQRRLLQLVAAGVYQVVLVPGPFVFSLRDDVARDRIRRINAGGCAVLELPRPHPQTFDQETTGLREPIPWASPSTSSTFLPHSICSLD
jgi:hypothetical protein